MSRRISNHIRSNVIAYVALFVALGGTAWAIERNSVKSKHIVENQVKTGDVRDDTLPGGGLNSADIADLHAPERQAVNDPTPGNSGTTVVPLFTSGVIEVEGQCADDLTGGDDFAAIRVSIADNAEPYSFSSVGSDPLASINDENVSGSGSTGARFPASITATDASNSNLVESAYFVVVAGNGDDVSGLVSAELNDSAGSGSDCTFSATGIG